MAIAMDARPSGLWRVIPGQVSALLAEASLKLGEATRVLSNDQRSFKCFKASSEGEIAVNAKGFVEARPGPLREWLETKVRALFDRNAQSANMPRDSGGRLDLNPERWGVWAECDPELRAWRDLYRMAEMRRLAERLADGTGRLSDKHEPYPVFRTYEPNWAVYRGQGCRVFRPASGRVFAVGTINFLRPMCTAWAAVKSGYQSRRHSRLINAFLNTDDPIGHIASELWQKWESPAAGVAKPAWESPDSPDSEAEGGVAWRGIAQSLLEVLPLGLSSELAARVLAGRRPDLERYFGAFTTASVENWTDLLSDVVYDLRPFLKDAADEVIAARAGESANTQAEREAGLRDPSTFARARRNAANASEITRDSDHYRAWTLFSRVTRRETQTAVRRAEVLMAEDEVRAAISFTLEPHGAAPAAWAENEFLLDLPEGNADQAVANVQRVLETVPEISFYLRRHVKLVLAETW